MRNLLTIDLSAETLADIKKEQLSHIDSEIYRALMGTFNNCVSVAACRSVIQIAKEIGYVKTAEEMQADLNTHLMLQELDID